MSTTGENSFLQRRWADIFDDDSSSLRQSEIPESPSKTSRWHLGSFFRTKPSITWNAAIESLAASTSPPARQQIPKLVKRALGDNDEPSSVIAATTMRATELCQLSVKEMVDAGLPILREMRQVRASLDEYSNSCAEFENTRTQWGDPAGAVSTNFWAPHPRGATTNFWKGKGENSKFTDTFSPVSWRQQTRALVVPRFSNLPAPPPPPPPPQPPKAPLVIAQSFVPRRKRPSCRGTRLSGAPSDAVQEYRRRQLAIEYCSSNYMTLQQAFRQGNLPMPEIPGIEKLLAGPRPEAPVSCGEYNKMLQQWKREVRAAETKLRQEKENVAENPAGKNPERDSPKENNKNNAIIMVQ